MMRMSEIFITIKVALVFIKFEKKTDYVWVLTIFEKAFWENSLPELMLTDRKLALRNAIHEPFLTGNLLLHR